MDIKRSCALSPFIDNNKSIISTPQNQTPPIFPFESITDSIYALNSTPLMNIQTPEKPNLLDEQFRLERDIAEQSSIKTQDSFTTTYSSLQTILSQMQVKLASVFLQETEYLKQREQRLEQDEKSLTKRMKQLENIQVEREQLEKEFSKLQDRLETAVVYVMKFRTDGVGRFCLHFFNLLIFFRNKFYGHYFPNLTKLMNNYLDLSQNPSLHLAVLEQ
jgi:hypothetical protein